MISMKTRTCVLLIGLLILGDQAPVRSQTTTKSEPAVEDQQAVDLTGTSDLFGKLQLSGFGVGGFEYAGNTSANSFFANKMAISAFEQTSADLYFFGQLTTSSEGENVETEIDNLILSYTSPRLPNLTVMGGKFDAPLGFERDDEPLNFQSSNSFNFELGRPVKYTGVFAAYTLNPTWDISGYVVNGENLDLDNNKAKTVGARLGVMPGERSNVGLSLVLGFPKENDNRRTRFLADVDYTLQPRFDWLLAGEVNFAREEDAGINGRAAKWFGGQLTSYYQATPHWGTALRYDLFRDDDGARTGLVQTLQSFTLAPSFKLQQRRYGAYATREHTTFGIPQFEIRLEFRVNRSTRAFFEDDNDTLRRWETRTQLQTVIVF